MIPPDDPMAIIKNLHQNAESTSQEANFCKPRRAYAYLLFSVNIIRQNY